MPAGRCKVQNNKDSLGACRDSEDINTYAGRPFYHAAVIFVFGAAELKSVAVVTRFKTWFTT